LFDIKAFPTTANEKYRVTLVLTINCAKGQTPAQGDQTRQHATAGKEAMSGDQKLGINSILSHTSSWVDCQDAWWPI
jgi:hypothetical protein